MITDEEIRVGNVLQYKDGSFGIVVLGLGKFEVDIKQKGFIPSYSCDPIPLTPEILEKCGFEKWTNSKTYSKEFDNGNTFQIRENNVSLGGNDSCTSGHVFKSEVKYVHQLQNLYFALTGEELKINMKIKW